MRLHPARFSASILVLLLLAAPARSQGFTYAFLASEPTIAGTRYGSVTLADYDQDGDFDFMVTGATQDGAVTNLYQFRRYGFIQVGNGTAEAVLVEGRQSFTGRGWYGTSAWHDVDLDGDLDVVVAGAGSPSPPHAPRTRLFRNNDGRFAEASSSLQPMFSGSASWADYDNDGDPDLLLAGARSADGPEPFTTLYRNDDGRLEDSGVELPALAHGTAAWADYDNDGDLDVLLAGADREGAPRTEILRNDGGSFTPLGAGLPALLFAHASWGDYDDDGDPDLLLTGAQPAPSLYRGHTAIYRNDGGSFTALDLDLPDVFYGGSAWGDFDNDGRLDFVLMGSVTPRGGERIGRFYRSTGDGFTHVTNVLGAFLGTLAWGDFEGDGDLDLVTVGESPDGQPLTSFYRNESTRVNQRPDAPANPRTTVAEGSVTLEWDAAQDPETPSPALTYNLRVGTAPGRGDVMAPLALASGRRLVPGRGNAGQNTAWTLRALPAGTYFWSVHTLDHSFAGSAFATEGTFTVSESDSRQTSTGETPGAVPARLALHAAYPNPFSGSTTLRLDLPAPGPVVLRVYDVLGRAVRTLHAGPQAAGHLALKWDGRDEAGRRLAPGVYVARLDAAGRSLTRTVVLVE